MLSGNIFNWPLFRSWIYRRASLGGPFQKGLLRLQTIDHSDSPSEDCSGILKSLVANKSREPGQHFSKLNFSIQ